MLWLRKFEKRFRCCLTHLVFPLFNVPLPPLFETFNFFLFIHRELMGSPNLVADQIVQMAFQIGKRRLHFHNVPFLFSQKMIKFSLVLHMWWDDIFEICYKGSHLKIGSTYWVFVTGLESDSSSSPVKFFAVSGYCLQHYKKRRIQKNLKSFCVLFDGFVKYCQIM